MIVAITEQDHGLRIRRVHRVARVGTDARASRQNPEAEGLQVREAGDGAVDREHGVPSIVVLSFRQRLDGDGTPILGAELQDRDRFIDAAQIARGRSRICTVARGFFLPSPSTARSALTDPSLKKPLRIWSTGRPNVDGSWRLRRRGMHEH